MAQVEFIPNKITSEYWQRPEVRAWAEPVLFSAELIEFGWGNRHGKTYGENIIGALLNLERTSTEHRDLFEGDPVRSQAFFIAVGQNGLNPEAQSYDELWAPPTEQEAA